MPATCPYLSQLNPVHILTSHLLKIHLNIILPSSPGSSNCSLTMKKCKGRKKLKRLGSRLRYEGIKRSRGRAPHICNFGARWRWLNNITPRPPWVQERSPVYRQYKAGWATEQVSWLWQDSKLGSSSSQPGHCPDYTDTVPLHCRRLKCGTALICITALINSPIIHFNTS